MYFPKDNFFSDEKLNFPVVIGEGGACIVEKVGDGVTNLAVGDNIISILFYFLSTLVSLSRFYATKFNSQSKYAGFQEYTLISADLAGQ